MLLQIQRQHASYFTSNLCSQVLYCIFLLTLWIHPSLSHSEVAGSGHFRAPARFPLHDGGRVALQGSFESERAYRGDTVLAKKASCPPQMTNKQNVVVVVGIAAERPLTTSCCHNPTGALVKLFACGPWGKLQTMLAAMLLGDEICCVEPCSPTGTARLQVESPTRGPACSYQARNTVDAIYD